MMNTLFEDLISRDAYRVWSSASSILHLWDRVELGELAQRLPEIQAALKGLPLGGALIPNQMHVDNALKRMEYVRDRKGCLCDLYSSHLLYNPAHEERDGHVQILDTVYINGRWVDHYICECTVCSARFQVQERESHYLWWAWQRTATGKPVPID